jgi:ubiquinone/menaquinone biosynthesis C-methylase UbiE
MAETTNEYYQTVADFYDQNVVMDFERRAKENFLLERMREDFRKITQKYPFTSALEIGCGPGFDIAWFAQKYPKRKIVGIDVSPSMLSLAQNRIDTLKLPNASIIQCNEKELFTHFNPGEFDLVFVYFGALNTTEDLKFTANQIFSLLKPGGHAVITFVNKWYMREMLVQLLKMRFDIAFGRLKKVWGGYSPDRFLPSRCYSPSQIKNIFSQFSFVEKKGYSIFSPAWYNYPKFKGKDKKLNRLWKTDEFFQKTFLWSMGEYTLFVMQKP